LRSFVSLLAIALEGSLAYDPGCLNTHFGPHDGKNHTPMQPLMKL
jgi:hypothetical protein